MQPTSLRIDPRIDPEVTKQQQQQQQQFVIFPLSLSYSILLENALYGSMYTYSNLLCGLFFCFGFGEFNL